MRVRRVRRCGTPRVSAEGFEQVVAIVHGRRELGATIPQEALETIAACDCPTRFTLHRGRRSHDGVHGGVVCVTGHDAEFGLELRDLVPQ